MNPLEDKLPEDEQEDIETEVKNVSKKEKEPQAVFKTRFTLNGTHYAEIHEIFRTPEKEFGTYQFAVYGNSERVTYCKEVETYDDDGNKVIIKPAPQIAQQKLDKIFENDAFDFLKFPPAPIDYSNEYALYVQIKNYIHKYTQVRDEDEALIPLWIMKAILSDILKETSFPLIHVIAPYGKGKSRLLQVMTECTPYGFYLINLSAAPLKRVSQLYSPILFVDEKGSMDNETTALINSKFNRNSVYLNADKEIQRGFSALIGYRIYGPMVMAGRTPFRDDAIESKSFQVDQNFELTRTDIPRKIKGETLEEFEREGKEIRGKLLQFRINWCEKINSVQSSNFLQKYETHLEPRLFEIVSFFEDLIEIIPELKVDFSKMLEYQIVRNVEVANGTPNGMVASTLLSLIEAQEDLVVYDSGAKKYSGIPLRAIYSEIGENYAKQTGKIIQALGLSVDYPRIEIPPKDDNDDPRKVRLKVVRVPDDKKVNELKSRYDPEYIKSVLASIGQAHQTSLDNEDNEDNEKGHTPNDEYKEGLSKNHHPHNPLNPDSSQNQELNDKKQQNENLNKIQKEGLSKNHHPHNPLNPDSSQEPEKPDVQSELSLEIYSEAKNRFKFFQDPNERLVIREVDNVLRWLHFVKKLSEEEARQIVTSWTTNKWVTEVDGQIVTLNGGSQE
jgi:hypothetical protein